MAAKPASFRSLVGRLAADGGEILRQLAVEHEKEVMHLVSEIARLQETIAHLTGEAPPEVKLYSAEAADKTAPIRLGNPSSTLPMDGKESGRRSRQARKDAQRPGKPDENALAKAFAFVDAIHDDRVLMHAISVDGPDAMLEVEDTSNVLRVAAEIADFARHQRDYSGMMHPLAGDVQPSAPHQAGTGPGGPSSAVPVRPQTLPEGSPIVVEAREVIRENSESSDQPGVVRDVRDPSGQPGIKLSTISPPVKAPDRMPEPPSLPDDDDFLQSELEGALVLNEHLRLNLPSDGPAAMAMAASLARESLETGEEQPASTSRSLWSAKAPAASSRSQEDERHSGVSDLPADAAAKPVEVPVFLKAGPKPENDAALSEARLRGSSPMPSRETTTWQAEECEKDFESPAVARPVNALDAESPDTPAAEAPSKKRVQGDDWQALLKVRGAKWRPSGDDGVGIAMYLDAPKKAPEPTSSTPHPTSI